MAEALAETSLLTTSDHFLFDGLWRRPLNTLTAASAAAASACLSGTVLPLTQNGCPKGIVNIWGVGWIFSTASPGLGAGDLGAGSRGRTAGTPPFSGKLHSEASELLPWGGLCPPTPIHVGWLQDSKLPAGFTTPPKKKPLMPPVHGSDCPHPLCPLLQGGGITGRAWKGRETLITQLEAALSPPSSREAIHLLRPP